jgi:peptidoglycan/LPS O-acetylase OafA/YrhL
MENRIKELDGLRGMAVTLVIAFHAFEQAINFTEKPLLKSLAKITSIGWVGVDIFFVLSGFLITSILLDSKTDPHYFKNFYGRRILRIFPLYYVVIIFVIFFAPKVEPEFFEQLNTTIPILLLYQQNWSIIFQGFGAIPQYLLITWSLAIEEQFYFIWPFIVYYLRRDQLIRISLWYIAASIIARALCVFLWPDLGQTSLFFYYSPFARFEEILFGSLLALLIIDDQLKETIRKFSLPVFGISLAVFLGLCLSALPGRPIPEFPYTPLILGGYTTAGLFSASLIAIFITQPAHNILRRIFQSPVLTFLGKYSYSMYVFHVAVILILLDVFQAAEFRGWSAFIIYPVAVYIITIVIALFTWNVLEKHILALKKYFEYKNSSDSKR